MNPELRKTICLYRLSRAEETLTDAQFLFYEKRSLSSAMNRIYYSLFYAVSAYAQACGFQTSKHSGLRGWYNQNVMKNKRIDIELGSVYNSAYDQRNKGDYADFAEIDDAAVQNCWNRFQDLLQR